MIINCKLDLLFMIVVSLLLSKSYGSRRCFLVINHNNSILARLFIAVLGWRCNDAPNQILRIVRMIPGGLEAPQKYKSREE